MIRKGSPRNKVGVRPHSYFSPSPSKSGQGNSSKKCLDFLGFIRPNWDFPIGYGDSKQKILSSSFGSSKTKPSEGALSHDREERSTDS